MTSDPKKGAHGRTDPDPHGRDHDAGLAGAAEREDVDADERFANSREDGVVDKRNYLDDVGDAVAGALGSLTGTGEETEERLAEKRAERDRSPAPDAGEGTGS